MATRTKREAKCRTKRVETEPRKRVWNASACDAAGRLAVAAERVLLRFRESDDSRLKELRAAYDAYDAEIMAMGPLK